MTEAELAIRQAVMVVAGLCLIFLMVVATIVGTIVLIAVV